MPRILRIINRFNLGGPTYNAAYLSRYMPAGFQTMLVGGMKDESEASSEFILQNLGVPYTLLPEMRRSINPLNDRRAYKRLVSIIKEFKPDIVHTHAAKAGALGRMAASACKVPVIVHTFHGHVFHSYFGSLKTSAYKMIERRLAARSNAIVAISERQKQELAVEHRIAPAEKIHVIPLGFDLNRFHEGLDEKRAAFRKKHQLSDETVAIGIIGRLVPVKNHILFLEAIKFVKDHCSAGVKAFIVGDGEERQRLQDIAGGMGLTDSVVFCSWEKQVENVYPGLDIVCLSSFNEGTPVSLIEAQAACRPIVSTRTGGIDNVVLSGKTALLSSNGDQMGYVSNLKRLVDNSELRQTMGAGGWDHVHQKFHYTRLVSDMTLLYNELLGR